MTKASAEKITGLVIEEVDLPPEEKGFMLSAYPKEGLYVPYATASGYSWNAVIKKLIEACYAKRRQEAFEKAGWRCERCGGILSLQAHHKTRRSKKRDDAELLALCPSCHDREHR